MIAAPVSTASVVFPPLRIINPHTNPNGITILIAATSQLEANARASAAFQRAARAWESVLTSRTTVILGADFGATDLFGRPFGKDVLGGSVPLTSVDFNYAAVRAALVAAANNDWDVFLYSGLPAAAAVFTDIGSISSVAVPSAVRRAWGVLPPGSANAGDLDGYIAYNASFPFDFDRTDGIDTSTFDFEATATHEMGHALGFESTVGDDVLFGARHVSVLDLFRFRSGTTSSNYGTSIRIQTAGGDHEFWNSQYDTPLSTGRRDESGGSHQAGHWLDNFEPPFYYWGVMDPVLVSGIPSYLTVDDLIAMDMIGYAVAYPPRPAQPTDLAAVATSPTTTRLTWQSHSTNQSEFRLEFRVGSGDYREFPAGLPATATAVTLTGLSPNTDYTFTLVASNAGGYSEYSNTAFVHTPSSSCEAPRITAQPTNQTVPVGGKVTYHVGVAGTAPLSFQWYVGNSGDVSAPIPGATYKDIVFGPLDATYVVWMRASNACGSADTAAAIMKVTVSRRRSVRP